MLNFLIGEDSKADALPLRWNKQLAIATSIPPLAALFIPFFADPLPYWDYWLTLQQIVGEGSERTKIVGPLFFFNEHIQSIPALLVYLNFLLTSGSNSALAFLVWLTNVAILVILLRQLRFPAGVSQATRSSLVFTMSALVFLPASLWNLFEGLYGLIWVLANLFVVLSIACIVSAERSGKSHLSFAALIWLGAAYLTHSSSFAFFPVFMAAAIYLRQHRWFVRCSSVVLVLLVTVWAINFERPVAHAAPTATSIQDIIAFFFTFLGNPWTHGATSMVIGALIFVCFIWLLFASRGDSLSFWKLLAWYGLGNAAITAAFRSSMGWELGFSERYATPACLYVAALTIPFAHLALARHWIIFWVGYFAVWPYVLEWRSFQDMLEFQSMKRLASIAVRNEIPDITLVSAILNPSYPRTMPDFPEFLSRAGHTLGEDEGFCRLRLGEGLPKQAVLEPTQEVAVTQAVKIGDFHRVLATAQRKDACLVWLADDTVAGIAERAVTPGSTMWYGYLDWNAAERLQSFYFRSE